MKINFFTIGILLATILCGCKKFEGDENSSSYTVNGRLTGGVWNLNRIEFGNSQTPLETGEDIYACVMDFAVDSGSDKLNMKWGYGIVRDTVASFNLSSDKESLSFFNTDFDIYSMTWTDMIIVSKSSGNTYYFEKWINTTVADFPIEYDIGFYMPFY